MKAILTLISLLIVLMAKATPIKIKVTVGVKTSPKDSVMLHRYKSKGYVMLDAHKYGDKYKLNLIKY